MKVQTIVAIIAASIISMCHGIACNADKSVKSIEFPVTLISRKEMMITLESGLEINKILCAETCKTDTDWKILQSMFNDFFTFSKTQTCAQQGFCHSIPGYPGGWNQGNCSRRLI